MTHHAGLAVHLTPEVSLIEKMEPRKQARNPRQDPIKSLMDVVLLRKSILPALFILLYWGAVGGILYGTWWLYRHGNWAWVMSLVFGNLMARAIFEILVLKFKTLQQRLRLAELVRQQLEGQQSREV